MVGLVGQIVACCLSTSLTDYRNFLEVDFEAIFRE